MFIYFHISYIDCTKIRYLSTNLDMCNIYHILRAEFSEYIKQFPFSTDMRITS